MVVIMWRKRSKVRVRRPWSGSVLVVLAEGQVTVVVGRGRVVCLMHGGWLMVLLVVIVVAFGRVRCHGRESHDG